MKKVLLISLPATLIFAACDTEKTKTTTALKYPETKKVDQVDDYFGTEVADPYRWLEDDNAEDTKAWVIEENKVTNAFLSSIPFREKIEKRYEEIFNYPKLSAPWKVGDYFFYSKNSGLQNQSVIYYKEGVDGEEKIFIDPNTLSENGTVSIGLAGKSKDNKYMAYSRSEAGSDWSEIHVREIATNKELPDVLQWVKFSGASWYKDGFFYSRYQAPEEGGELSAANEYHSVYYHKLGDPQEKDELVYKHPTDPKIYHFVSVPDDEEYIILYQQQGTEGVDIHFKKAGTEDEFSPLITGFDSKSSVIDHMNGKFLVRTDVDAPKNKLVAIDPNNPAKENWETIIPEKEHMLERVSTGGGYLFADYLQDVSTHIYRYNYDGTGEVEIELPGIGSAGGFGGEEDDKTLYYSFTSFTYPTTIFAYDVESGGSTVYNKPELKFNPEDFEANQVFFKSKDGTKVPMFIVHKKGLVLDGTNPTLLYAYGGFNINLAPSFSTSNIILLENGGIYAVANLRGGGEYGEEWHKAGMLMNKQNVFDDFIAAAEYLIDNNYTSSEKLAIAGGSNGGLLVGACMTQRPELYKVAFPAVGVMDMLRYHKFTVGWGWVPEYGSSEESKEMFEYLYGYSPVHNLEEGVEYPATMVTTADHDDRVVPAHSFKFAATLQEKHAGENPVLIRIETDAGHGAGKPTSKIIEEQADKWAFMFYNMGYTDLYE